MQPSGIPHVDEPTRQLHERILDEVLRELAIAGEQVREPAGIGRVPLEQLYEDPTLELRSVRPPPARSFLSCIL